MSEIVRIRKNFSGAVDKFVVCSEDGTPQFTWHDQKAMKNGIDNLIALDPSLEIIKELKKYPYVDGMYGNTDLEKLSYALWLWKNRTRHDHMVFGYARVSTVGQAKDGNSLESQRELLMEAGAEEIFHDVYTGTTTNRPKLNQLMEIMKPGDTLIVTKLDRIARSVSQGADLIEDLISKGIKIKILAMGDATLDDSPTGKLIRHIFLSFAEFERDMIVQRTQEGKAIARKDPNYKEGRPPKFSKEQRELAMKLLNDHSYTQVSKATNISVSTLVRMHRKQAGVGARN